MNNLSHKYGPEIEKILAKYPPEQRRSAVMPLLYLAQRDKMHVSGRDIEEIGELIGMHPTEVASIVGFYTLYYDEAGGLARIQVCTDLPCALRGADDFAAGLCERLGIRMGETTPDGKVTVEAVMCLAGCDRAPMFQLQDKDGIHYYENQTVESAVATIEELRERE